MHRGLLEGFKVGNTFFSHFLFADNTLIFCNAMPSQLHHFGVCFCYLKLPLMGNVEQVSMLANILGCGVASLLVKYLGLPLGASIASD
jgi:hypothetical protein